MERRKKKWVKVERLILWELEKENADFKQSKNGGEWGMIIEIIFKKIMQNRGGD